VSELLVVASLLAFAGACFAGLFFAALFFGVVMVWAEIRVQFARAARSEGVFPP